MLERLAAGDKPTLKAARRAGEYLGILLQNLANSFNPAVMVLGGPMVQLGNPFIKPALSEMEASAGRFDFHRHVIRLCRFGIDASALGAAGSVFQRFLYSVESDAGGQLLPARVRLDRVEEALEHAPRRPQGAGVDAKAAEPDDWRWKSKRPALASISESAGLMNGSPSWTIGPPRTITAGLKELARFAGGCPGTPRRAGPP